MGGHAARVLAPCVRIHYKCGHPGPVRPYKQEVGHEYHVIWKAWRTKCLLRHLDQGGSATNVARDSLLSYLSWPATAFCMDDINLDGEVPF